MVLVKKVKFFHLSILRKIGQGNVFDDTLERKKKLQCLDYKNKELKQRKNWDFSKEVSPWFWSKN